MMNIRNTKLLPSKKRAMTREEVIKKALRGEITWIEAVEICRISPRHMRRV
jgi:hypothetical protein